MTTRVLLSILAFGLALGTTGLAWSQCDCSSGGKGRLAGYGMTAQKGGCEPVCGCEPVYGCGGKAACGKGCGSGCDPCCTNHLAHLLTKVDCLLQTIFCCPPNHGCGSCGKSPSCGCQSPYDYDIRDLPMPVMDGEVEPPPPVEGNPFEDDAALLSPTYSRQARRQSSKCFECGRIIGTQAPTAKEPSSPLEFRPSNALPLPTPVAKPPSVLERRSWSASKERPKTPTVVLTSATAD